MKCSIYEISKGSDLNLTGTDSILYVSVSIHAILAIISGQIPKQNSLILKSVH